MIQLLLKFEVRVLQKMNFFVKYMFNVMDEKAPFLRVRETYSGLRNCERLQKSSFLGPNPHYFRIFFMACAGEAL